MVHIIIVNYKGWYDTLECLESIYHDTEEVQKKIYVVDNSPDTSSIEALELWAKGRLEVVETNFPDLVLPNADKPIQFNTVTEEEFSTTHCTNDQELYFITAGNNGFAAANNVVINQIIESNDEGFVFLLNNDTVLKKNTLSTFLKKYGNEKNLGIAGGVILEYSDPSIVQTLGGRYHSFFGITSQVYEGQPVSDIPYSPKIRIDYPSGAAMFLSSKVLRDLGPLNEKYFLYFEEIDWVKSGSKKFHTTYLEDCFVYHKGGVSIGSNEKSYISDKYAITSRLKFAKSYNKGNLLTVYLGILITIIKRLLKFRFRRAILLFKDFVLHETQ